MITTEMITSGLNPKAETTPPRRAKPTPKPRSAISKLWCCFTNIEESDDDHSIPDNHDGYSRSYSIESLQRNVARILENPIHYSHEWIPKCKPNTYPIIEPEVEDPNKKTQS